MARSASQELQQSPSPVPSELDRLAPEERATTTPANTDTIATAKCTKTKTDCPLVRKRCKTHTHKIAHTEIAVHCDGWSNAKAIASRASANDGNPGSSCNYAKRRSTS